LVDLDPQAHLTYGLGVPSHELDHSVYDVLKGELSWKEVAIERNQGLTVLPSTLHLSGVELEFAALAGREFLLREGLSHLRRFDYVLIDCPPSLGLLTLNALTRAQELYIPVQTEFLALQGLARLLQTVAVVTKRLNRRLRVTGIIGVRYDRRKNLNREVVDQIRKYSKNKLFKTLIRENISLAEAPKFGQSIFDYRPKSPGAQDYMQLTKEVIKRSEAS
ncbi:ParA family protein, partial [bacterium]|nr:ParA family protein [bacterium]